MLRAQFKNKMLAWYERWQHEGSSWQNLDSLFKPTILRFFLTWFATAPVIARLLEQYPELFVLPFSWWILWLASLLYAAGFAVQSFAAPTFVKRYPNYPAYAAKGHSPRWIAWEFYYLWQSADQSTRNTIAKRLVDKGYARPSETKETLKDRPIVGASGTTFEFEYNGIAYQFTAKETDDEKVVVDVFWEVLARWANQSSYLRTFTWICVSLSFLLVVFTAAQNIWFVGRYFIMGFL